MLAKQTVHSGRGVLFLAACRAVDKDRICVVKPTRSRLHDRSVPPAVVAPAVVERRVVGDRETPGRLLVEVDAQAGTRRDGEGAVAEHRAAGEDVLLALGELAAFLDAEVRDGQVEMDVGGMADGGDVAGAVPGAADANLSFLYGASRITVETVFRPLLEVYLCEQPRTRPRPPICAPRLP